jgi:hypothetical protein
MISILVASCADTPPPDPDLSLSFDPIASHQTKDLNMNCSELQDEIHDMEQAMHVLDKQIAFHQKQSEHSSLMSAYFSAMGTFAPTATNAQLDSAGSIMSSADASHENSQQMTTTQLRTNYEQRHDALIQIFFARKCGAAE